MKKLLIILVLLSSCVVHKQKVPHFIQWEKYVCLNTEYNVRHLNELYGSQIFDTQFIVEQDSIWNIYQADSNSVVLMFQNTDTTNYIYTSSINRHKYKKL